MIINLVTNFKNEIFSNLNRFKIYLHLKFRMFQKRDFGIRLQKYDEI